MQKHDIDRFYRKVMTCRKAGRGSSCNVVSGGETGRPPRLLALPHQLMKRSILPRKVQGFPKKDGRAACRPHLEAFEEERVLRCQSTQLSCLPMQSRNGGGRYDTEGRKEGGRALLKSVQHRDAASRRQATVHAGLTLCGSFAAD